MHVAFAAKDKATVDEFYRTALAAGGRDNGKPAMAIFENQQQQLERGYLSED